MNAELNPNYKYQVGSALLPDAPTYVFRQADGELYQGLRDGKCCYVFNSRQMGKSSLRVKTTEKLRAEGFACVGIEMRELCSSNVTEEEFYATFVSHLVSGLELEIDEGEWWRNCSNLRALSRFNKFIEDVLLTKMKKNIVIFIDEIDSIFDLPFKDDFFAFIRSCYNKRADNDKYQRLHYALFGVATPSDLINDKFRTPFNVNSKPIELAGFTLEEAQILKQGLGGKIDNLEAVLREILNWTMGQPFLTQKLCDLIRHNDCFIKNGYEAIRIKEIIQTHIIENWLPQDNPDHLRTIQTRILHGGNSLKNLKMYQKILQGENIIFDERKREHLELRLSGLVVNRKGNLKVFNKIYSLIFDLQWIQKNLGASHFSKFIPEFIFRLTGFISRGFKNQYQTIWYDLVRRTKQSKKILLLMSVGLFLFIIGINQFNIWQINLKAKDADELFNRRGQELSALIKAIEAGETLEKGVDAKTPLLNYYTVSPLLVLDKIIHNIYERNQLSSPNSHNAPIRSVIFSPNGQFIATGGEDGQVNLWDSLGNFIKSLNKDKKETIYSLSFSPDGELLAGGTGEGTIKIWYTEQGQEKVVFQPHNSWVRSLSFHPKQNIIASAGPSADGNEYNMIRLSDDSGNLVKEWNPQQGDIYCLSYSPDGRHLATAGGNGTVKLWDVSAISVPGKEIKKVSERNMKQDISISLSFSPEGQLLATATKKGTVKIWDVSANEIKERNGWNAEQNSLTSLSFSYNGRYLATAGEDSTVKLWDLAGKPLKTLKGHTKKVWSVSFDPSDKSKMILVTGSADNTARLWQEPKVIKIDSHRGKIRDISVGLGSNSQSKSDQRLRLAIVTKDGKTTLWDVSEGESKPYKLEGNQGEVKSVIFIPEYQYFATLGNDGKVQLWSSFGKPIKQPLPEKVAEEKFKKLAVSSSGKTIALVTNNGIVQAWKPSFSGGKDDWIDLGNSPEQDRLISLDFSANEALIAVVGTFGGNEGKATILDTADKKVHRLNDNDEVTSISFSPTLNYFVVTGTTDGYIKFWDLSEQKRWNLSIVSYFARMSAVPRFERISVPEKLYSQKIGSSAVKSVMFGGDGNYLATLEESGEANLWDVSGYRQARLKVRLNEHSEKILNIGFSPDGQRLATVGDDGIIRIWTLDGKKIAEFEGAWDETTRVRFSPEGKKEKYIVATEASGTIKLRRIRELNELLAEGCNLLKDYRKTHLQTQVCANR